MSAQISFWECTDSCLEGGLVGRMGLGDDVVGWIVVFCGDVVVS